MRPNKQECFYLAITFQSSLTSAVTPGAYPRRKHWKGPPLIGFALALPSNSKTWLERVSKGKLSSLLGLVISDKGKKFYDVDTRRTTCRSRRFCPTSSPSSRKWPLRRRRRPTTEHTTEFNCRGKTRKIRRTIFQVKGLNFLVSKF